MWRSSHSGEVALGLEPHQVGIDGGKKAGLSLLALLVRGAAGEIATEQREFARRDVIDSAQ